MMAAKTPKLTDAEIKAMEDEHKPRCAYVQVRQLEKKIRSMSPRQRAEYFHEVYQDMIASGDLVEHPEGSGRYIAKHMLELIKQVYDEADKKNRPAKYNPNGLKVLKK